MGRMALVMTCCVSSPHIPYCVAWAKCHPEETILRGYLQWARHIQGLIGTSLPLSPVLRRSLSLVLGSASLPRAYESSICMKMLRKCVSRRYLEMKPILDPVFCYFRRNVTTHSSQSESFFCRCCALQLSSDWVIQVWEVLCSDVAPWFLWETRYKRGKSLGLAWWHFLSAVLASGGQGRQIPSLDPVLILPESVQKYEDSWESTDYCMLE